MDRKLIVRIFACILAALLLLGLITPAFAAEAEGEGASLGIIGGADGPTAIFVATTPGSMILPLVLIAGILVAVVWIIKKRKK